MSEILTTDELDAIIDAFREPEGGKPDGGKPKAKRDSGDDPATQLRLNEAQMSALRTIHASFAWAAESEVSDFLDMEAEIKLSDLTQAKFKKYQEQRQFSLFAVLAAPPLKGRFAVEIGHGLCHLILDAYFRRPNIAGYRDVFNEVELAILRDSVGRVMGGYAEAWRRLARLKPAIKSVTTDPAKLHLALPDDPLLVAQFSVRLGGRTDQFSIGLPIQNLKPFLAGFATRAANNGEGSDGFLEVHSSGPVRAAIDVGGEGGRSLAVGAILSLNAADSIEILAEGKVVGTGEWVLIGDQIGVRVTESSAKKRSSRLPRAA